MLLELAKSHEVESLLARTLTELCADLVPVADLETLRRRTEEAAAANRAGAGELLRLSQVFDKAGVSVLPFRGVGLAALIYGDLTLCAPADPVALVRRAPNLRRHIKCWSHRATLCGEGRATAQSMPLLDA